MKAVFISYNVTLNERILELLDKMTIRGFTQWHNVSGRGSYNGEPHFGSHAWPAINASILTIVEDHKVAPLLERLKALDEEAPMHGVRAFVWGVEEGV